MTNSSKSVVAFCDASVCPADLDSLFEDVFGEKGAWPRVDVNAMAGMYDILQSEQSSELEFLLQTFESELIMHDSTEAHFFLDGDLSITGKITEEFSKIVRAVSPSYNFTFGFHKCSPSEDMMIKQVFLACVDPRLGTMSRHLADPAHSVVIRAPGPDGILAGSTANMRRDRKILMANIDKLLKVHGCQNAPIAVLGHHDCGARKLRTPIKHMKTELDRLICNRETGEANKFLRGTNLTIPHHAPDLRPRFIIRINDNGLFYVDRPL